MTPTKAKAIYLAAAIARGQCSTCGKVAHSPYRVYRVHDKTFGKWADSLTKKPTEET